VETRSEERAMSLSVNGSNTINPFVSLQALWQQATSPNSTQASSDPLSALLNAIGQQNTAETAAASGTSSANSGAAAITGSTAPQFGPQTLQALLALQANGSTPQSLAAQFENATNGADPLASLQTNQSQAQHGHHRHHHHMDATGGTGQGGSTGSASSQNPLTTQLMQLQTQLSAPAAPQSITTV
jgi:hypothetical protein